MPQYSGRGVWRSAWLFGVSRHAIVAVKFGTVGARRAKEAVESGET
jgi:hypothetical protein